MELNTARQRKLSANLQLIVQDKNFQEACNNHVVSNMGVGK